MSDTVNETGKDDVVPAAVKPKAEKRVSMSADMDPKAAKLLKQLQVRATAAREMRRKAPAVNVGGKVTIPQKNIINRISRKEGGQDGAWHHTFQDKSSADSLVDRGYEPSIDPETGKWVEYLGDQCWKIPTKDFEQIQAENSALSKAMLGEKMKADAAATGETVTTQEVNL